MLIKLTGGKVYDPANGVDVVLNNPGGLRADWCAKPDPVTVTTWGVIPLAGVKTSDAGETVPSVASELESAIVTLIVGNVFSATVKVAVPPVATVWFVG